MKRLTANIEKFESLIREGYIIRNKHPEANLWIYNYSQTCQYEGLWNEITLHCRGLILDEHYNIIAKPLPKFFNVEEIGYDNLPDNSYEIHEKLDGSLGILYWLNNKAHIATRGSFNSTQSVYANTLLHKKYKHLVEKLDRTKTYMFEIIYPLNRVVVDYGSQEKLVLLAIINNYNLKEEQLVDIGFPLAKTYKTIELQKLKALNLQNNEGFVIKYKNGYRVKIKFKDYIYFHRIMTQLSSLTVWHELKERNGLSAEWLDKIPDEFYTWVKSIEQRLQLAFTQIEKRAKKDYKLLDNPKATADYFLSCPYSTILFSMKNNKNYDQVIWRLIRPKFEKPNFG